MFSSKADFTGMTRLGKVKPRISQVVQKAFVEVTEDGAEDVPDYGTEDETEAAAATGFLPL